MWPSELATLQDGVAPENWLREQKKRMATALGICSKHLFWVIRCKEKEDEDDKTFGPPVELDKVLWPMARPSIDKFELKIDETECADDNCLVHQFGNSRKRNAAPSSKKKKNTKKASKHAKDSDESDDDDDDGTSESEDDDLDFDYDSGGYDDRKKSKKKRACKSGKKSKKKAKDSKTKKGPSAKMYASLVDALDKRFADQINEQGIVELTERAIALGKVPKRIPSDIMVKYAKKKYRYKAHNTSPTIMSSTHENHNHHRAHSSAEFPEPDDADVEEDLFSLHDINSE
eukprot:CAMPEP_0202696008 /NCGR_PEP_ID=MMETSP1385-20130828/9403_1 /ASSEMBLY_ACC=CAM_ASM_000861 /TAXON_ID=933848 /ORGANISM="Elphidium margaritaceum" /LENGTH=287 /DNA_ID=CAMNT_0049352099 /DNA_START=146 /DNA_END=1009 /DNA_ORIENTATION=-